MSGNAGPRVLAIAAAPRADGHEGTEFLRVLVALRACGRDVTLLEAGAGTGSLTGDADLSTEGERYLTALREEGVVARASGDDEIAAALAQAEAVVLLPDPSRPGIPPLLRIPKGVRPGPEALADLLRAGQVAVV